MSTLEDDFHHAMIGVYETARQHGYIATYFKRMLDEHGGLNAAKRLLTGNTIKSGLMKLWELRLLEHSMEALVVQERFCPLLAEAEIQEAQRRLDELGLVRP